MNPQRFPKLFEAFQIGSIPRLSHRIVMAPLTRMRSEQPGDIPGPLALEYYAQRASEGGLIITPDVEDSSTSRTSAPFRRAQPIHQQSPHVIKGRINPRIAPLRDMVILSGRGH